MKQVILVNIVRLLALYLFIIIDKKDGLASIHPLS